MPKVSICIPAYNQVKYLKKCIDSVLDQTYTDFEIVITDDSPGDIVKNFLAEYDLPEKIRYYKNPVSLGSPENWNEAIRRSSGEYIKILHHDDWLVDNSSLARYVQLLDNHPDADFGFSATKIFYPDKAEETYLISDSDVKSIKENPLVLFSNNLIGAPSTTIHRKSSILFDRNLKWLVDIEFYIRLLAANRNFVYSTQLLVTTSVAEGRITEDCIDNKDVEITEYLYVLAIINKGENGFNGKAKRKCIKKVIRILEKYNIEYGDELLLKDNISSLMRGYFLVKKFFPLGARIIFKLL